ncbi:hypothetical protein CA13_29770 [Planctomycetes bacterium CA13]|uniref:BNR/Asp-box repeat protein n=1 Tax=Novipirellula herctigrandis TaxID=2527986 RepID=A0A5C5Z2H9_9BACT|nr:hypothetical protein CA13_29770 [Planctomycetes bacterium CA13]
MRTNSTSLARTLILWSLGAVFFNSFIQASELELIRKTTVEENALTFAIGPAASFAITVNGRTHQQDALTTYRGYQYATYVDSDRCFCIGRRKLPSGSWEVISFKDHKFKSNDSHNTAVIGICDRDGTIHLAFDHHASQLNYRVSKIGAAHQPDSVKWNADLFGGVTHTLGAVIPDQRVTYPRFFSAPNGNLMLYYRAVTSGNGDGMIEEYDGEKHGWTPGLGKFIARDIGIFTERGRTSPCRCPYMNSLSFAGERLHASWVWRDRFEKTNPANQHDLCYAYSDDYGRTWCNSAGKIIGRTGQKYIHLDSPGLIVVPIPPEARVANQNTHYAYDDGSIHIVMRHRAKGCYESRYHHYWRSQTGAWRQEILPFTGKRPKLVGTEDRMLVLVYNDDGELFIAKGLPDSRQTRWRWSQVKLPEAHSICGEALVDLPRWEAENVLSVYSQEEPSRLIRTERPEPVDGFPSALNVVDYRF